MGIDYQQSNYEVIPVQEAAGVRFYTSVDPGSYVPPHWHDEIELAYIQEGEVTFTIENNVRVLKPGQIILVNPNVVHSTKCLVLSRAIVFQIPLSSVSTLIPNIRQLFFTLNDSEDLEAPQMQKVDRLKRTMEEMQLMNDTRPDGYLLRFNSLLYDLIFQLYKEFSIQFVPPDLDYKIQILARLTPVLNYIAQYYNEPVSMQEAARMTAFDPTYFCRFFKKYMGVTFLEYRNEVRLSHVLRDLISTKNSLSDILSQHGFTNCKLFRRVFHQHFNTTPSQLRKSLRTADCNELGKRGD